MTDTLTVPEGARVFKTRTGDTAIQLSKGELEPYLASLAPDERQRLAELNPDLRDAIEKSAPAPHTASELFVAVMKSAEDATASSYALFQSGLEAFTKRTGEGINAFICTDEGRALAAAYEEHRTAALSGPIDTIAKAASTELEQLGTEIEKRVTGMAVAHNLDRRIAKARLEEIDPEFAELVTKHAEAHAEYRYQLHEAEARAQLFHTSKARRAEQDAERQAAEAERLRKRRAMMPSERALMDLAEARAAEQSVSVGKALNDLLTESDAARALKDAADEERTFRAAVIR